MRGWVLKKHAAALAACAAAAALAAAAASAGTAPSPHAGDVAHGRVIYQICMGCHSVDEDDVGPRHRGVVGRLAGTVPGYAYSPALKSSHIVWNRDTLDRWLANPQALVPGAKMFFAMPGAQDRADVIAYLAELR
jgi:cytochrome c